MESHPLCHQDEPSVSRHARSGTAQLDLEEKAPASPKPLDLLDELELLLHRKGRMPVLLVTVTALALCFLVVGILMATGILLVTFFIFVSYSETPQEAQTLGVLGKAV